MTATLRLWWVLVVGLAATACEMPRPFDHTKTGAEIAAPSVSVLCVAHFPGLPPALSDALRTSLADELVRREVLAVADDDCPPATPRILAWEAEAPPPGAVRLMLSRPPINGRPVPPAPVTLPVPEAELWPEAAARWAMMIADRLGYRPPAVPSARSPMDFAATPGAPAAAKTEAPAAEKVLVDLVDGAGVDGNTMLRFAMIGHLRRAGFQPVVKAEDGARFAVKGTVDVGEPKVVGTAEVRRVRIVWAVRDAAGAELAQLEQANTVPAASLPRAWAQAADLVAAAAAPGIADAVMRARAAQPVE